MVDETKYLTAIRYMLVKQNHANLAQALDNADCSIVPSGQYSRVRWNCYYTTVHFYVRWQYLGVFNEDERNVLLGVADLVMPKDAELDVMAIEISPKLEDMPDEEDQVASVIFGRQYKSLFGSPSLEEKFQCDVFMIMPFAADFEPLYRKVVSPTVTGLGLTIKRGDDPFSEHTIMFDVWSMLNACKLVIADCTGRNPNVFYELGIAHAIGKPVIMLTQNLKELPFDVQSRRAIEYDMVFHKIDSLKEKLTAAIRSILPGPTKGIPF